MAVMRQVDVFSAGSAKCKETVKLVTAVAGRACAISIHDMNDPEVAAWAGRMGIRAAPAVVVDGILVPCRDGCVPDATDLGSVGLGEPVP